MEKHINLSQFYFQDKEEQATSCNKARHSIMAFSNTPKAADI